MMNESRNRPKHIATQTKNLPEAPLLPPNGAVIRVSPWRQQLSWIAAAVYAFLGVGMLIEIISRGSPVAALVGPLGVGIAAAISVRMTTQGASLDPQGIKVRGAFRTRLWHWNEIDHLELRKRGSIPRLRIHLSNGEAIKAVGFFARSPAEEERGQALFTALEERLEAERAKGREQP